MSTNKVDPQSGGTTGEKKVYRKDSDRSDISRTEVENSRLNQDTALDEGQRKRLEASARLENPLADFSPKQLAQRGEDFCKQHGITDEEDIRAFRLGAMIAGNMNKYDTVEGLTDREKDVLDREITHKWSNPTMLYAVIIICSLCAAVQGMDETVVNGAQIFYKEQFGIGDPNSQRDSWLLGLVNATDVAQAAPYICSAFIGCWLTEPLNKRFGRRGTVFISCLISAAACFWQAFTNTWWHMFIARFALGFGIGPKSATTLGYVADLAFYEVPDRGIDGLNWRLMMGSALIPAVVVVTLVFFTPESPRWYLTKDRHSEAYKSILRLRYEKVQAARDLFYMDVLIQVEKETMHLKQSKFKEIFTIRRNRNAAIASEIVMYMQQFCGVNAIAYYSTQIFIDSDFSEKAALAASLGFGAVNFLFAIPAFYTIDTFGRRKLLLTTFPLMAIFLFYTGFSFYIPAGTARIANVALGIYLFGVVYSPGEGPVPFTYSAEAYPLYIRPFGMSLATATTWFFNAVVSITWPALVQAWTNAGAFSWYAAWNIVGWVLVLLFLPETKEKTLEELDAVFDVPLRSIMRYGIAQAGYFWGHIILRRDMRPPTVPTSANTINYTKEQFTKEKHHDPSARV
ncbi:hypothetical protein E0Z10_g3390 [Xylaria hypoxylon]|uniref:Major facilitator superfamily (MFS) profile domain-containing protein n=1 Tax=Xylaria hypoxylon TaxID=37992 RepID=A0A4Z0Z7L5_9PEZI|nr:hypothetical protein E0Z10_g3390 [Xylaria hypoxylon]